jgi:hypothetical protein
MCRPFSVCGNMTATSFSRSLASSATNRPSHPRRAVIIRHESCLFPVFAFVDRLVRLQYLAHARLDVHASSSSSSPFLASACQPVYLVPGTRRLRCPGPPSSRFCPRYPAAPSSSSTPRSWPPPSAGAPAATFFSTLLSLPAAVSGAATTSSSTSRPRRPSPSPSSRPGLRGPRSAVPTAVLDSFPPSVLAASFGAARRGACSSSSTPSSPRCSPSSSPRSARRGAVRAAVLRLLRALGARRRRRLVRRDAVRCPQRLFDFFAPSFATFEDTSRPTKQYLPNA